MAPRKKKADESLRSQALPSDEEMKSLLENIPSTSIRKKLLNKPGYWLVANEQVLIKQLEHPPGNFRHDLQNTLSPHMPYIIKDRTAASRLLNLPRELRDMIIDFVFDNIPAIITFGLDRGKKSKVSPPLLRVCWQLYHEAAEALYGKRTVSADKEQWARIKIQHKPYIRLCLVPGDMGLPRKTAIKTAYRRDRSIGLRRGASFCPLMCDVGEPLTWINAKGEVRVHALVGERVSLSPDDGSAGIRPYLHTRTTAVWGNSEGQRTGQFLGPLAGRTPTYF